MADEKESRSIKTVPIIALAVSVLAIGGYFFLRTRADHKPAGPPEKVTIAYSATTDAVLADVAQVKGYYLQEGLEVTPHLHPYGKAALAEVLEGKADFATVAETPVMLAIMNGAKISIIATIQTTSNGNAVVARKDKGILAPGDLKGRRIGVTSGTTADFFMDSFLAVHGIARGDMKVVDLKAEELPDALVKGDVDAVSAFQPYLLQAQKKLGDRGDTFYDENIYTWTFNIAATQDFIRRNPGKVRKLLIALIRAEEFVTQNPAEAQKIVADFNRLDLVAVRGIWPGTSFSVSLDQSLVLALEDESEWAIKNRLTKKVPVPNYLNYIYFDGLESVKPSAARILR